MKIKYFLIFLIPFLIILLNFQFIIFNNNSNTEINENILNYFQNKEELKFDFTEEESIHLKDVKSLIFKLNIILIILTILTILILILNKEPISKQLIISGSITIAITLILSIINYQILFTTFHKLLFTNNYWLLPRETLLIQTYPSEFFINISKRLALNIILTSIILVIIGIIQNVRTRYKSNSN